MYLNNDFNGNFTSNHYRLPVLDSTETVEIIKKYLAEANFTVFEVR